MEHGDPAPLPSRWQPKLAPGVRSLVGAHWSVRIAVVMAVLLSVLQIPRPAQAQQGADQINVNGQFIMAARAGLVERASALLQEGAAINSRDRNGDTALNLATAKGNQALAALLIGAGADVNLANLAGVTPLMGAAFSGKPEIVRQLLAAGASTAAVDRVKKTAAVYAAARDCTGCIALLLDSGVAVDARLDNQETLLMWAAGYGNTATVTLLLQRRADPSLRDNRGKTALDIASEGRFDQTRALLENPYIPTQ